MKGERGHPARCRRSRETAAQGHLMKCVVLGNLNRKAAKAAEGREEGRGARAFLPL